MFDIVDFYHDGDLGNFSYNSGYEDAQAADWIIDYDNSSVDCSLDWMDYVTCSDLIVRWRRDFDKNGNLGGSEISLADECKEIPAYSFVYQWETPIWTTGSAFPYGTPYGETYNWYPTSVVMQPVNCHAHPMVVEQPESTPKPDIVPVEPVVEPDVEPVVEPDVEPEEDPETTGGTGQELVDKAGEIAD